MHVDTVDTTVWTIIHLMVQMSTLSVQIILVILMILSLNLMKYTHWNCHYSCSLLYQQLDAIEMSLEGAAQSQLKFLWRGADPVPILVEGWGSLVGGRGHLGVEKRVGVSFIRAEAATEAIVVSMDSSSKTSMSNESTRETSFVASATILKEHLWWVSLPLVLLRV